MDAVACVGAFVGSVLLAAAVVADMAASALGPVATPGAVVLLTYLILDVCVVNLLVLFAAA